MKSRFVTPKFDSIVSAVVLTANDVVATVMILDVDEEGYAIKTVAEVSLPYEARTYRQKHPQGISMFQRGDLIEIRCEVNHEQKKLSDELIEKMLAGLWGMEDENAELFGEINERAKGFTEDWIALCKKDLAKRTKE